jgi:hypothetical protein
MRQEHRRAGQAAEHARHLRPPDRGPRRARAAWGALLPALLLTGCMGPSAKSQPGGLSAAEHEALAAEQERAAEAHARAYAPAATRRERRCRSYGRVGGFRCTTQRINPTASHLERAAEHCRRAAEHRAAAAAAGAPAAATQAPRGAQGICAQERLEP